jgi:hypothetical protein
MFPYASPSRCRLPRRHTVSNPSAEPVSSPEQLFGKASRRGNLMERSSRPDSLVVSR